MWNFPYKIKWNLSKCFLNPQVDYNIEITLEIKTVDGVM
jgi:hypothetical protein